MHFASFLVLVLIGSIVEGEVEAARGQESSYSESLVHLMLCLQVVHCRHFRNYCGHHEISVMRQRRWDPVYAYLVLWTPSLFWCRILNTTDPFVCVCICWGLWFSIKTKDLFYAYKDHQEHICVNPNLMLLHLLSLVAIKETAYHGKWGVWEGMLLLGRAGFGVQAHVRWC